MATTRNAGSVEDGKSSPRKISVGRRLSTIFRPVAFGEPAFSWKVDQDEHWAIVQADGSEISLVCRRNQSTSMKKFGVEVRGIRDVHRLLEDAIIILNSKPTVLKSLVGQVLQTVATSINGNEEFYKAAYQALFIDSNDQIFANTLQGFIRKESQLPDYDPSWLCAFCNLTQIKQRYIAIVRMKQPTNFGETCQEVRFFILILCPTRAKETKTGLETGRTFATLFSDPNLRNLLLMQHSEDAFKSTLSDWANKITLLAPNTIINSSATLADDFSEAQHDDSIQTKRKSWNCVGQVCSGVREDLMRRLPHYLSDYTDGIADRRSMQKTISTSVFLYFACLLPTIAFATLNSQTTHGRMDVRKGIFAQTVGQLIFAVIGGQHLSILLTTAPLSLFVKIIFSLSEFYDIVDQFEAFYCCVGLWCSFFLFVSAILNMSNVMKYCTRSTEEIFACFISIAFLVYAAKDITAEFQENYNSKECTFEKPSVILQPNNSSTSMSNTMYNTFSTGCRRDTSLLYVLLTLGTFWFGYTLYNFKNTPFLQQSKREVLSDYALPLAVILFSFIGSFLFSSVPVQRFKYDDAMPLFQLAPLYNLDWTIIMLSGVLGFCLAVLIFMDQNIGSAIVNNPSNKLKKGSSYNWDLVVISIINVFSSLYTLPWLHVALPHAPMHVKSLADIEERVEYGQIKQTVVRVRETRLTTILSHVLMGLSLLLLPYPLSYILPSVFDGLYLYMGITALGGNQLFERILLVFTEQMSYPPSHHIRKVPQRIIHQFTLIQVLQLALLCVLGFSPYPFVKVLFPLVLLFLLFARSKILPRLIERKYLDVMD